MENCINLLHVLRSCIKNEITTVFKKKGRRNKTIIRIITTKDEKILSFTRSKQIIKSLSSILLIQESQGIFIILYYNYVIHN